MKKIASLVAILLLVIAGIWIYKANKFEQFVNERFIPLLKRSQAMIITDTDSIIVEKFKFKVILKDVIAFPESENFAIKTDLMSICYNPITDKLTFSLDAGKVSIGTGDNEIYILSKGQTVKVNQQLFKHGFDTMIDDMDISFYSKNPVIYLAKNDTLIASSESSCSKITSELKNNVYSIKFTTNNDKLRINPEARYSKNILDEFVPKSELAKVNDSNYLQYYYNIMDKTGPSDFDGKYSLQMNEGRLKSIISKLLDGKNSSLVFFESFITSMQENYAVNASESLSNKALDHSWSLAAKNDNGKITTDVKLSCVHNYKDQQKQEIGAITKDFLFKTLTDLNFNVTEADVASLSENISDLKKLNIELNVAHDVKSDDSENSLKVEINDFSTELKGEVKDKTYHLNAEIDTPSLLINGMTKIHDESLRQILSKSKDPELLDSFESLDLMMQNIKENGFAAISVFHNKDTLGENDTLYSDIVINLQNFEFKVNDKGMLDILTDENILKFLQVMPKGRKNN